MFEKPLGALSRIQKRYPVAILMLILLITLFFGYYAFRIETDSSFDVLYSEDSYQMNLKRLVSSEFGATDSLYILVSLDEEVNAVDRIQDIRHPDVLRAMKALSRSLETES